MNITIGEEIDKLDWYINNLSIAYDIDFDKAKKIFKHGFEEAMIRREHE